MTARASLWLGRGIWVALFTAASVVVLAAGSYYYQRRVAHIQEDSYLELHAISDLKCGEIQRWRKERVAQVRGLSRNSARTRAVGRLIQDTNAIALRAEIQQGLMVWTEAFSGAEMSVVSTEGAVLVSTGDDSAPPSSATQRAIRAALTNESGVLSDLFLDAAGVVRIDAVAAVRGADGRPLALIISRTDAAQYLFPLIQSWPLPSRSAETLLVQREGDDVLFLNELRHRKGAALRHRQPLTLKNLPASQAALGKQGRFEGNDDRGVPVLADLQPVSGSDWFMVAKLDQSEIYAEARNQVLVVGAPVTALIVLAAVAAAYGYRRQQERMYRGLFAVKQRELAAQAAYRTTLYSIGDGVITTDTAGRVREMNRVAEDMTGWKEAEAHGRPMAEVFPIIDEATRAKTANPVEVVLREGRIVGLANHTLLIARDGTERPIADSAAPIRGADGVITGVVLVFSDQTVQHATRRALRDSEERLRLALSAANQGLYDLNVQTGECVVNAEYARMLGYDPATFRETNAAWRERLHPDDRETVYQTYEDYVAGRRADYRVEFRQRTAAGGWKWILSRGKLMSRSADGRPLRMLGTHTDITERKRTEEALRTSEAEFRALAEAMPQIVWVTRPDGWNIYFNQQWMDYTGLTLEESNGHGWNKPFHPDDQQRAWDAWRQATATVGSYSLECRLRRADGAYRWWLIRGVPWCGADGKVVKWFGTCTDIHDLKEAAESLRLLGSAVEQSRESILITDSQIDLPGPRIIFANPAFTRMTGYAAAEVVGLTPRILHGPRTDRAVLDRLRRSLERGEPFAGEAINYRKDGREFVLEWHIAPLRNEHGIITHFVSIQRDITERRQAEAALLASEEKFRAFVTASTDVLYQMSPDWGVMRHLDGRGFIADALQPNATWLQEYIPAADQPQVMATINQAIQTRSTFELEHRVRRVDGTLGWTYSRAIPVLDAQGEIIEWFGAATDITERKRVEEAWQVSLREKEALLKEVHHRVKNNLQVITSLLRLEAGRVEHHATRQVLRDMQHRLRSMALLHETLYRTGNFAQVDMAAYLGQIASQLFRAQTAALSNDQPSLGLNASSSTIKLELNIARVYLTVERAIPCGLIVSELVANSLKHAFPEGRSGVVRVELQAENDGLQVSLRVSDTGVGLPANLAERQARSLGLQLVSDLSRQLEGRLEMGSGAGASFTVAFQKRTGGDTEVRRKEF